MTRLGAADDEETRLGAPSRPRPGRSSVFQPGDAFAGRYRVLKELGAGGMGVVYQAWDEVLNVVVAVKVIRPDVVQDPEAARDIERRFKRELLLARQVTHKHVVRIHDLGDVEGTKYITMTFVEGHDLSTELKRDGKLPVSRVMRLARQIASGLEAAHEAGVVHRDLKPANIMVDAEDQALIMDFGIALSAAPDPRAQVTATVGGRPAVLSSGATTMGTSSRASGAIIGTLDYMSPEQSRGQAVDHRSDIYTFGLILTDLLLGSRTTKPGLTPLETLTDRVSNPPVPLAQRDSQMPAGLDAVITRCLQLKPEDRFQKTQDLVRALSRLDDEGHLIPEPRRLTPRMMAAAGVMLTALVGGTWWLARGDGAPVAREPVSVLIANFRNSADDPVFTGLIEQALGVGIEGASFIEAYSRRDAIRLARTIDKAADLDASVARLVALREGIDVVVSGEISASGRGYTIRVNATRPADEEVLLDWSTTAGGKDKVLEAIGEAAAQVRETLGDSTAGNAAGDAETFTAASIDAAKAYSQAQELQWAGRSDDAIAAYQRTLELDPNFGRAHAGIAALYANQGRTDEAETSYQAALGMLDRMTEREKFRTRGGYYLFRLNGDSAMKEFEALVAQYPADTSGLANLAFAHFLRRDMKSARDVGIRASEAYPQNIIRRNNAALYAMYAGDFEEAARFAGDVLKLNPEYPKAYVALGMSQLASGQPSEAVSTFERLRKVNSPAARSFAAAGLVDVALYEGRQQEALKLLDEAIAADRASATAPSALRLATRASVLAARGDRAGAVKAAREARQSGRHHGALYIAAGALIDAGQPAAALEIATDLDQRLEEEPRVYGMLIKGEAALAAGRPRDALTIFQEAVKLEDTWMGRLDLGRAYLALNAFAEASSEFDRCLSRRGEATAVFLDDQPTYRLFPPVQYYLGAAREGLKSASAGEAFKSFLAIKQRGDEQGLVVEARKRLGTR